METSEHSVNGSCALLIVIVISKVTSADPGDQLAEVQVPVLLLKSHLAVKRLFPCLPWALVFPVK